MTFGDSAELSQELLTLVASGRKTATASLLWEYEAEGEPLPQVGDVEPVMDWDGRPVGRLKITGLEIHPFLEVPAEFARDEGEGDLTLESWRRGHWRFFSRLCRTLDLEPSETMPIVCVRFQVVDWNR